MLFYDSRPDKIFNKMMTNRDPHERRQVFLTNGLKSKED